MLNRLTDYLLKHRWQAIILTFVITFIPVVGMANILIAGLMTLCVGVLEGAIFTLVASLPPFVLLYLTGMQDSATLVFWIPVVLTTIGNFLTWAFAVLLRRHYSWSLILQLAALLGVLVISVIHLAYPNVADWWGGQLQTFYNQATVTDVKPEQIAGEAQVDMMNIMKNFATGIITAFVLLTAIVQVMLARWWQVVAVNHARLGKEFQYIHLSRLAGILFILSILLYYLENSVVFDILPVLCLLFSAAGLSLVHYLCGTMEPSKGRFWISILYVALMYSLIMLAMLPLFSALSFTLPVMLAMLVLSISIFAFITLGLFDVWFDMRKRIRKI